MSGFYWIASYPKSGNTWLRMALLSLRAGGAALDFTALDRFAPIASDREVFEDMLGLDADALTPREILSLRPRQYAEEARMAAVPLLRKVHDAWTRTAEGEPLFPPDCTIGAIYVVRDPRDVAVSFAHHNGVTLDRSIERLNARTTILATAAGGRQLQQSLLDWSGHAASWLDEALPRPLLIRYETMLDDPAAALAAAAAHLGMASDAATLHRAVTSSSFQRLQAEEDRVGFREKPATAARFFRRGLAGTWREALSRGQAAAIERAHDEMMSRLGYL